MKIQIDKHIHRCIYCKIRRKNKEEILMTITVFVSVTGHMVIAGVYNDFFSFYSNSLRFQQAPQLGLVGFSFSFTFITGCSNTKRHSKDSSVFHIDSTFPPLRSNSPLLLGSQNQSPSPKNAPFSLLIQRQKKAKVVRWQSYILFQ